MTGQTGPPLVVNQHHGTQVLEVVTYASLIEKRLLKILETYPNAETISSHHLLNPLYAFGPNFYQRNLAIGEELIFFNGWQENSTSPLTKMFQVAMLTSMFVYMARMMVTFNY